MKSKETIDEIVDKAIDQAIEKMDSQEEDLNKKQPKPFRFLTNQEVKNELAQQKTSPISVMKEPSRPKIFEKDFAIVGLGDIQTIESVIKKHQASRKFK